MAARLSFHVVSWDGNTLNDSVYDTDLVGLEWGLPPVSVQTVPRMDAPHLVSDVQSAVHSIRLRVSISESQTHAQNETNREQLAGWFNPRDKATKSLIIRDGDGAGGDAGTNERSINAICSEFVPMSEKIANGFWVTLIVDDDVFWRSTTETTHVWEVSASGESVVVDNPGDMEVDPVILIRPTTVKSAASYADRQFVTIRWRVSEAAQNYPIDIVNNGFNTQAIVGAGDMQADGDDLRVEVDGTEVARWLQDINTTTTQVWCNLDFQAKWESEIEDAIGSGDTVTSIEVDDSTRKAPATGILVINSEIFIYSAKDDKTRTFTISQRAAHGSSAANHSADDTIWWCQHAVYMKWNNSAAIAPVVDDNYKPIFELDSTNTSWNYDEFGADNGLRSGAWKKASMYRSPTFYTANRDTDADPWEEVGVKIEGSEDGRFFVYNPCGITVANFQNGEKYTEENDGWNAFVTSSKNGTKWVAEDTIAVPAEDTWESWSDSETLKTGSKAVGIRLHCHHDTSWLECADVTLTLNSSNTPVVALVGSSVAGYDLACVLANSTTGKQIDVAFLMALDQALKIDTDKRAVTYLLDDSNQFQAVDHDKIRRLHWLKLDAGLNTLVFTEANIQATTVQLTYKARYY